MVFKNIGVIYILYIMKRFNISIYIIFFLLALMLTSCSDGSSSDNGPVQVSLSLSRSGVSSRIVSVDEAVDLSSFAFYYKATPQWSGQVQTLPE